MSAKSLLEALDNRLQYKSGRVLSRASHSKLSELCKQLQSFLDENDPCDDDDENGDEDDEKSPPARNVAGNGIPGQGSPTSSDVKKRKSPSRAALTGEVSPAPSHAYNPSPRGKSYNVQAALASLDARGPRTSYMPVRPGQTIGQAYRDWRHAIG